MENFSQYPPVWDRRKMTEAAAADPARAVAFRVRWRQQPRRGDSLDASPLPCFDFSGRDRCEGRIWRICAIIPSSPLHGWSLAIHFCCPNQLVITE
jgi:hypothetical protein